MTRSNSYTLFAVLGIVVVSIATFAAAVIWSNYLFLHEEGDHTPEVEHFLRDQFDDGYIKITAHVIQIDFEEEHMVLDLELTPYGRFEGGDGRLAVPLQVDVSSSHHDTIIFEAGYRMEPREVTLSFYEGQIQNYPYDRHRALFEILVSEVSSTGESPKAVPAELDFLAFHHGYAFDDTFLPPSPTGYVGFDVVVERSPLVVSIATLWMVMVWGLTVVMIGILVGVLTNRIEAKFELFGYMTGFLLALFFIRELFPYIPSQVGVHSDIITIFFAELVAASVAMVVATKWMIGVFRDKGDTSA